ncbi:MAG TPA: MFS transporter [Deltaproteobacteria bacterium]|jgi:predicted MFS family arabinose efflux permease|nr:MFS transporter [Deltaproteobacteria bacterium]
MSQKYRFLLVLGCSSLMILLSMGMRQGMGLFLEPITSALGVDRETFSLAIAWQNLILALPLFGVLADVMGFRRVALLGGVVYGGGLWLASQSETAWGLYINLGGIVGVGIGLSGMIVVMGAVGQVAPPERRSTAFGIVTVAFSIGMFTMIPLLQFWIEKYGWSGALEVAGGVVLAISLLALGLPDKTSYEKNNSQSKSDPELSLGKTLNGARTHSGYLLLNLGFFVCGFHVAFIGTHLPAFLQGEGVSASAASWALAMIGLFNIFGSLVFGRLGDSLSKKSLLSLLYALRTVVISLFLAIPLSDLTAIAFGAAIGFLWLATVPLTSGIVAQVFGTRYLTTLWAIVFFSHQLGAFLGVWLGGRVYDSTGSYTTVWLAAIVLGLIAAVVHLPIREQPWQPSLTAPQPAAGD